MELKFRERRKMKTSKEERRGNKKLMSLSG
jgi:hypothetical protein